MNTAIIGSGNVGQALAQRWLANGHRVIFGSREADSPKMAALLASFGPAASSASLENAPNHADVAILAVPWEAALSSVRALGDLTNNVLIDATNPIAMNPAGLEAGLLIGHTTSAAEQIADVPKGARVVKAFNQARFLEPLGMLWIHLCHLRGMGPNVCFHVSDLNVA